MPATSVERLAWHALMNGGWPEFERRYVFDVHALTNDRPYFAGYEKLRDLPKTLARLDLFQDDWGYLILWATLGVATVAALPLVLIPLLFGRRVAFAHAPGKLGTILYFACLGIGYITVEVGLISRFTLALSNATISAAVLIAGVLVFSGVGSLMSERLFARSRAALPAILGLIAGALLIYTLFLPPLLSSVGAFPYPARIILCFLVIAPVALLMGFPMATAMNWMACLGKDHMFVWAWGINGSFSVIGAVLVPIIATTTGLGTVLLVSAAAYLLAIPGFFAVVRPTVEVPAARPREPEK